MLVYCYFEAPVDALTLVVDVVGIGEVRIIRVLTFTIPPGCTGYFYATGTVTLGFVMLELSDGKITCRIPWLIEPVSIKALCMLSGELTLDTVSFLRMQNTQF